MSRTNFLGSCETTINYALKRITKLDGQDKKSLHSEFEEWISAIESNNRNYEILYLNKIEN